MFSYEVRVRQVNAGKMKAVATLVVDGLIEVEGFKIYEGSKGLFVSNPSHKGVGKDEEGNQIEKYYDDVKAIGDSGEELLKEIKDEMLKQYSALGSQQNAQAKSTSFKQQPSETVRGTAASAVTATAKQPVVAKTETVSTPPKAKKPLW